MGAGVEVIVAFTGGLLALLSPCSALLLPSFFAYAFPSRLTLVGRTFVFYAGLVTVLIPIGLGVGALGALVLEGRAGLTLVAGLLLISIGLYQFAVGGFELPGTSRLLGRTSGETVAATYTLGAVYGLAGFCAGPILGAVLTIAGASGSTLGGGALLAVYGAGMAAPLLVLALAWKRIGPPTRGRLRGRELRVGPIARHSSVVISSAMFIALGTAFIAFQGSNALGGLYDAIGASDLAFAIEAAVRSAAGDVSPIATSVFILFLIGVPLVHWQARRRARDRDASDVHGPEPAKHQAQSGVTRSRQGRDDPAG